MTNRTAKARSGYLRVRNESLVNSGTPGQLILMVFDALIDKLVRLETAHAERQDVEASTLILASMKLIQYGLRDAISFDRGGDVAVQLDRTYSVWMLSLEFFDSKRDIEKIISLTESVRGVREAWDSVFKSTEGGVTRPASL